MTLLTWDEARRRPGRYVFCHSGSGKPMIATRDQLLIVHSDGQTEHVFGKGTPEKWEVPAGSTTFTFEPLSGASGSRKLLLLEKP